MTNSMCINVQLIVLRVEILTTSPLVTWNAVSDYVTFPTVANIIAHVGLADGIGRIPREFMDKLSVRVMPIRSNPAEEDSDGDGIWDNEDTAPFIKGLAGGIIGEITIISCNNGFGGMGHAFLIYQSYVIDELDFSGLTEGYEFGTTKKIAPGKYDLTRWDYVSIGNAGGPVGGSSQPSQSGSSIDSDKAGVYFNREFANEVDSYENGKQGVYSQNKAYTKPITGKQLKLIIGYSAEYNYYNLITNNCAIVAVNSWNLAFSDDKFTVKMLPGELKKQIAERNNNYVICMVRDILGKTSCRSKCREDCGV